MNLHSSASPSSQVSEFLASFGRLPALVSRAPGRLELIGNHTDYNGGKAIGITIDRYVTCFAAPAAGNAYRIRSLQMEQEVVFGRDDLGKISTLRTWAAYPLAVLQAMAHSGLSLPPSCDLLVDSTLPQGAGMSSSAAFEIACLNAFLALSDQHLEKAERVKLCRLAENRFVGVPCGILDQGVVSFGEEAKAVVIDCKAETFEQVAFPSGARILFLNTRTRHKLVDSLYSLRHEECMAAARQLGVRLLCDATLEELQAVQGSLSENQHRRALHVLGEDARVRRAHEALLRSDLTELGKLMFESHLSSSYYFENSTRTLDHVVNGIRALPGVWGARLTGGGFGGGAVALVAEEFDLGCLESLQRSLEAVQEPRVEILTCRIGAEARTELLN